MQSCPISALGSCTSLICKWTLPSCPPAFTMGCGLPNAPVGSSLFTWDFHFSQTGAHKDHFSVLPWPCCKVLLLNVHTSKESVYQESTLISFFLASNMFCRCWEIEGKKKKRNFKLSLLKFCGGKTFVRVLAMYVCWYLCIRTYAFGGDHTTIPLCLTDLQDHSQAKRAMRKSDKREQSSFLSKKWSPFWSMIPSTSYFTSSVTLKHIGSEDNVSTPLSSPALYPPFPPAS